jgi:hypothetical protein
MTWDDLRDEASKAFGETPGPRLEEELQRLHAQRPQHVESTIRRITQRFTEGSTIRSPWAVVAHELDHAPQPLTSSPSDTKERELRIRQAEAFIRNAGLYIDLERELVSELFDEGGMLHPWRTEALEQRMVELWETHRPRGETAEADAERRAQDRVELRAKLKEAACESRTAHGDPSSSSPPATESPPDGALATQSAATALFSTASPEPESDPAWHVRPEPELENA